MNSPYVPSSLDFEELVRIRRDLHSHPELGYQEHRTAQVVLDFLAMIEGVEIIGRVAQTGVIARIIMASPGPTVALRADMDALPIEEQSGVPWHSQTKGLMHACGHDGHTTALLGAARVLAQNRHALAGHVILVFQPAEEALGGGKAICEDGILERLGVEAIFGMHNWPGLQRGVVATTGGVLMAASNAFSLTITGQSCHASQPHRGADPIAAGAQIVSATAQIRSRLVDPTEPAVISIGAFHAGTKGNIIPDTAQIAGTIRTISTTTLETIKRHLSLLSDGIATSLNCTTELRISSGYPAVKNTPAEGRMVSQVAESLFGADRSIPHASVVLAGEDFSFYLQRFPGAFWFMGVGENAAPLHNSHFDFCDDILPDVIAMHVGIVKKYCSA